MGNEDYNFIANKGQQKPSALKATSGKQRILVIIIGGLLLVLVFIIMYFVLFGSQKSATQILAPVAATQVDIVGMTSLGIKEARTTELVVDSSTINVVTLSHNGQTASYLGKDGKKIIVPFQSKGYEVELKEAATTGTYDKVYAELLDQRLDVYQARLNTAYSETTNPKIKEMLKQMSIETSQMSGDQVTPTPVEPAPAN